MWTVNDAIAHRRDTRPLPGIWQFAQSLRLTATLKTRTSRPVRLAPVGGELAVARGGEHRLPEPLEYRGDLVEPLLRRSDRAEQGVNLSDDATLLLQRRDRNSCCVNGDSANAWDGGRV